MAKKGRPTKDAEGAATSISMDAETWEAFQNAVAVHEGAVLSEEACKEFWRELCRQTIRAYIKKYTVFVDPTIL